MRYVLTIALALCLLGTPAESSAGDIHPRVDIEDGVTKTEAKLLAKEVLRQSEHKHDYRFFGSRVLENRHTYHHQDFWFVQFAKKTPFHPHSHFLVVIDKRTGEVEYAEPKRLSNVRGYRWIFHLPERTYL